MYYWMCIFGEVEQSAHGSHVDLLIVHNWKCGSLQAAKWSGKINIIALHKLMF